MEYFTVKKISNSSWSVVRFSEDAHPLDNIIVSNFNGKWTSNDKGFLRHKNEAASKRIRIVKHHVSLNEPMAAYWFEESSIKTYKV